ncbi:MAG TPA: YCF48-related protein, partial [Ignavibacteria bacterium]
MKKIKLNNIYLTIASAALMLLQTNLMSQSGWYPLESGTTNILHSIYFLNPNTGFLAGNDIVLKTLNGGSNWLIISQNFGGSSVYFIDQSTGFVCDGTLYRTSNGGVNWIDKNFSLLNSVYFYDSQVGYTVGQNSQIYVTADGGLTWFQQNISLTYSNFNKVKFISSNVGFVIGGRAFFPYYGIIYKTTDGGANWRQVDPSVQDIEFTGISFPTPTIGYLVGRYQYASSGVIYKTTDAGETWIVHAVINKDLNDICFSSTNVGYAVGEDGTILKTTDGSTIWNLQQSNTNLDINSVFFLQDDLGFTAGNSGSAQKTINGGISGPPFAVAGRVFIQGIGNATSGIVKAVKYNRNTNS